MIDYKFTTKKGKIVRDYIAIIIGTAIMGIGIGVFLVDAHVVPGGVSGLSMTLYYITNGSIPVGISSWIFNLPLFLLGLKELGKKFAIRTFVGFTFCSFFIDFFRGEVPGFPYLKLNQTETILHLREHDFLFLVLIGATLLGLGLGIIFKFKGTTAGSDIIASIFQKRFGIKPGQAIMLIDFFIISLAAAALQYKGTSLDIPVMSLTLYAFFLLFVSSKIIDIVIEGFDYARVAYIISNKNDEIAQVIMNDLSRGATALLAKGLYHETEKEVLMTVVPLKELSTLIDTIKQVDKEAFIIISNVHEVLGNGFRKRI